MSTETNDSWDELRQTAEGMRRAGAERQAVVDRLVEGGYGASAASALVDEMDRHNGVTFGDRPDDMSAAADKAVQLQREHNLAAAELPTGTGETEESRFLRSEASRLKAAGMSDAQIIESLVAHGVSADEADDVLFDIATAPLPVQPQLAAETRMNRRKGFFAIAAGVFALVVGLLSITTGSGVPVVLIGLGIASAATGARKVSTNPKR